MDPRAKLNDLLAKVRRGEAMTPEEAAWCASLRATPTTKTARNVTDLAAALGVTRRTINNWRKLPGCPGANTNGSFDVAAWDSWRRAEGLKGSADETSERELQTIRYMKARAERAELNTAILRGDYIERKEHDAVLVRMVTQAKTVLRSKLENELPPIVAGLTDEAEIQRRCRDAVDAVCRVMEEQPWKPPRPAA